MNQDLMRRALRCFLRANAPMEAGHCYLVLQDVLPAARLFEQHREWQRAAELYETGKAWGDAARCHEHTHQHAQAAACWIKGKYPLAAAWIYADRLERSQYALQLVKDYSPSSPLQEAGLMLVQVRGQFGQGKHRQAVAGLNRLVERFTSSPDEMAREPWADHPLLEKRFIGLTRLLQRPNLAITFFARKVQAVGLEISQQWEHWSRETFPHHQHILPTPEHLQRLSETKSGTSMSQESSAP